MGPHYRNHRVLYINAKHVNTYKHVILNINRLTLSGRQLKNIDMVWEYMRTVQTERNTSEYREEEEERGNGSQVWKEEREWQIGQR